jgi:hypothetical protein
MHLDKVYPDEGYWFMRDGLARLYVHLGNRPLPNWVEYPYFIWGRGINYDSDGDAYNPNKPWQWTELDIQNRDTGERVSILQIPINPVSEGTPIFQIEGTKGETVQLAAYLTALRSHGTVFDTWNIHEIPLEHIAAHFVDIGERIAIADAFRVAVD